MLDIEGRSVLLIKMNDQFHAICNRCTHQDYPLGAGRQIGFDVICPKHGARFDIRNGRPSPPAVLPLPVYATRIEKGHVSIILPEPNRDEAL